MRRMGVDPASGKSGIAVVDVERRKLVHSEQWTTTRALGLATNLAMFAAKVSILLQELEVEEVHVERVSSSMNLDTVRKIAYYEAAAMIACAGRAKVVQMNISSARKAYFGKGNIDKHLAIDHIRAEFGQHLTPDECEAIMYALVEEVTD